MLRSTFRLALILTFFLASCASELDTPFKTEARDGNSLFINIVDEYSVDTSGDRDISKTVQKAVNRISDEGGGRLYFPHGNYVFQDIRLKSNVHIQIEAGSKITPSVVGIRKSFAVFSVGRDGELTENVSIRGANGRFVVILTAHEPGIRVIETGFGRNFLYSDFDVYDQLTKFSSLTFGALSKSKNDFHIPSNGEVRNISTYNGHYGYGTVQAQAAADVLFENLHGQGGTTLRLETGLNVMNDLQIGGLKNIVGRGISCENGNSAVMISPHSMHNGQAHIDGVRSNSCGFAVRIGKGFISKNQKNPNLTIGTFAEGTSVHNVHAIFGYEAQLKSKHFKYVPAELQESISSSPVDGMDGIIYKGPAVAAVGNLANYTVNLENITAEGFEFQEPVISEKDAIDRRVSR